MHFSLRQLRIFEAVARHSSYTRAAAELHLTQRLFERIGKRIHLTDACLDFLLRER